MKDQLVFQGCTRETKEAVRTSWNTQQSSLERLLRGVPPDRRHLRLTVRRHGSRFDVRVVLILPTATLVATAEAHDATEALADASTRLSESVRRHLGSLRQARLRRRRSRAADELAAAGAALEGHSQERPGADFFDHLKPFLRSLRSHAHRELIIAQLQGDVGPGDLTVSELFDEVLVRAHDRLAGGTSEQPWEEVLIHLLHEILDEKARDMRARLSIDVPIPTDDPRYEAEYGWIEDNEPFWGAAEPVTVEEVLPDEDVREPVRELAEREQRDWVLSQLRTMSRDRRRAFALHALEGWEDGEIAALQGRSPSDVRADIEAARDFLQERLRASEPDPTDSSRVR